MLLSSPKTGAAVAEENTTKILDTHVLVLAEPTRLSRKATAAIEHARKRASGLFVSDVSLFEIANLIARKRLG